MREVLSSVYGVIKKWSLVLKPKTSGVSEMSVSGFTLLRVAPVIKLLPIQLLLTPLMTHTLGCHPSAPLFNINVPYSAAIWAWSLPSLDC